MKGLQRIRIKNFKAFSKQEEIKLGGKNLLVYGENGSGKSSLYFAIYTFLQCSNTQKNWKKYFSKTSLESLLNIHSLNEPSHIQLTIQGITKKNYELTVTKNDPRKYQLLKDMNLASDFISHRLLINFYNFRNSKEINLFSVFQRDIFPFFQLTTTRGSEYYSDVFDQLNKKLPVTLVRGKKQPVNQKSKAFTDYEELLNRFNTQLGDLIQQVNSKATDFYTEHFNDNKEELQIFLQYKEPLNINSVINDLKLNQPHIKLYIKQKVGPSFKKVDRPQSFLNEAKLTALALTIRFSLLDIRPTAIDGKILALDDLLVSLDMSNREKVIDLILKLYSNKFQLIILTHDRQFFKIAKNQIEYSELKNWKFLEMYADNRKGFERPFITQHKTFLEKGEAQLLKFDYPSSANSLRKAAENLISEILPVHYHFHSDGAPVKTLDNLITKAVDYYSTFPIDITRFHKLKKYKNSLLNPLSHNDLKAQIFRLELERSLALLKAMEALRAFQSSVILPVGSQLNFSLSQGADTHSFAVTIGQPLLLFKEKGKSSDIAKCKFTVIWSLNGTPQPSSWVKHSLRDFLNEACRKTGTPQGQDPFAIYQLAGGNPLNTLRAY